jgi:hypothetical protein
MLHYFVNMLIIYSQVALRLLNPHHKSLPKSQSQSNPNLPTWMPF